MQLDNKNFIPALQYATRHDLPIDTVIEMIRDGSLKGRSQEVPTDNGIETRWFVEVESSETEGEAEAGNMSRAAWLRKQAQQRRAGEPVSGETISVEPDAPLSIPLQIIGIASIAFGVIIGLVLIYEFSQSTSFLFVQSKGELTFSEFMFALGITLFYCVLGVFCLGIAKVIELLHK